MGRGSGTVAMVALTAGLTLGGCGGGERARDVGAAAERVPQSLVHSPDVYGLGLTGDAALLATDGSRLTITRMPLRGGADVRILRSPELVGGGLRVLSLGASDAVVGATFTPDDDEEGGPRSGLYGGPATGPLRQLEPARKRRPGVYEPRTVDADGDLLFVGAVGEVGRGPSGGVRRCAARTARSSAWICRRRPR